MTAKHNPPTLSYNRKALDPYMTERHNETWTLYYTPSTPEPATQATWADQLSAQGYTLVRWGRLRDRSIEVVARKAGS